MTYLSPKALPPNTITSGIRFQHIDLGWGWGGTQIFSCNTLNARLMGITSVLWSLWAQTPNTQYKLGADGSIQATQTCYDQPKEAQM